MAIQNPKVEVPVWLFLGPEIGKKNDEINRHRQIVRDISNVDEDIFYANETSISEVLSLLQNGSLFSERRFVVIRYAEVIKKKEDIALLSEWVSGLSKKTDEENTSWLFLVSDEISVDKKLENLIPKQNKKVFWEMFENQKTDWVRDWFYNAGFTIDPDAIDTILDLVENNTEVLRSECSRFSLCYQKGHHIGVDEVDTVLSHNREESAFTLFASLCNIEKVPQERLQGALTILQHIRNSKDSSFVPLIAALTHCFRKLTLWHSLHTTPIVSDFDLKINGFASKKMQSQYAQAAKIWTQKETILCLSLLSKTDMLIRTTGNIVEHSALQELLYSLVIKRGRELQVYNG